MVRMLMVPDVRPAATPMLAGTGIAVGFELLIEIVVPLAAGPVKVYCTARTDPPATLAEDRIAVASAGGFTVTTTV